MRLAIDLMQYVNAASALVLAGLAASNARRGGGPGRWGAAAFAALAVALAVSAVDEGSRPDWTVKIVICALLAFPYLMVRFAAYFIAVPGTLKRIFAAGIAAMVAATIVLPALPDDRPTWAVAYLVVGATLWTTISLVAIVGLWRAGAGKPTLVRRRTRLMSAATAGINVFVLLGAAGVSEGDVELVEEALKLMSLAAFAVGFAPPGFVRLMWRQPEQEALRRATEELVRATTVSEVTDTLLPHVARIVGGPGAVLWDQERRIVASFGSIASVDPSRPSATDGAAPEVVELTPPFGALAVATSPLTPFFGREEVGLLRSLGALADLSLARCLVGERERETQIALREAMQEAERANLAKSEFLSRMSHELRTPLNAILGFAQLLELEATDERENESIQQVLKAGRHLLELIDEVLDIARIEAGQLRISVEPVAVGELIDESLALVAPLATRRDISLGADLENADSQTVLADRQRLKQVLLNLLSNAIKYNRVGGSVRVRVRPRDGERLAILVSDTGPGMSPEQQERLFEPFDRLGAESSGVEGTGLGLALSKRLVELMSGTLTAESARGRGTTMCVELHRAETAQRAVKPVGSEAPEPARLARTILYIEDNLANLRLVERLLERFEGLQVLPAMQGKLGLELAREHHPDLILLDLHLPDLPGREVLLRLRAEPGLRSTPVIVISADATDRQRTRMLEAGADAYLSKPLDIRAFLQTVQRYLGDGDEQQ